MVMFWYCQCIWPGVTEQIISFDSFVLRCLLTVTPDRLPDPSLPRCQTNCLIDGYFFPSACSVLGSYRCAKQYSLGFVMGKFVSRASMLPLIKLPMQLHWNDIGLLLKSPSKLSALSICVYWGNLSRFRYLNGLKHRFRVPCLIFLSKVYIEWGSIDLPIYPS